MAKKSSQKHNPPQTQPVPNVTNASPTPSTQSLDQHSHTSTHSTPHSHSGHDHGHDHGHGHSHDSHSHSPSHSHKNPYSSYQAESTSQLMPQPPFEHSSSFNDHSHGACSHTKLAPDCGHNECNDSTDPKTAASQRVLIIVTCMCFGFMCVELVGGYLSGSLAIMTDAAHLLSDLVSFIISLLAITFATRSPTKSMTFGWKRVEIVGAIVSVFLIWGLTIILVYESIHRIINPHLIDVNGPIMLVVAIIGFFVNILMGTVLILSGEEHAHSHGGLPGSDHGHSHGGHDEHSEEEEEEDNHGHSHHGHSHGHDEHSDHEEQSLLHGHSHEKKNNKKEKKPASLFAQLWEFVLPADTSKRSINVSAAILHVLGDLMQSVGVIIAALVIWWNPALKLADPLCTLLFSVIVITTTFRVMKQGLRVLLEGTPDGVDSEQVAATLKAIPSVIAVHDLHIWSLSVDSPALAVHLVVQFDTNENNSNISLAKGPEDVLEQVNAILKKKWKITHTTIQLEEQFKSGVCIPKATPCKRTNSDLKDTFSLV